VSASLAPPGFSLQDVHTYLGAGGLPHERIVELLKTHGISDTLDPENSVVPVDACWRIFTDHAVQIDDELHRVFGDRLRPGGFSLIVARMLLCPTMLEAIQVFAKTWRIITPDMTLTVVRRNGGTSLKWNISDPDSELYQIVCEGMAVVSYALFNWMAGETLKVLQVKAPLVRESSASTVLTLMGAPVVYSGETLELVFAPGTNDLLVGKVEIEAWRDGVHTILSNLVLAAPQAEAGDAFANKVRAALREDVDQQNMAYEWRMSVKTLARRLKQEGCTFRAIQNEIRMQRAETLIQAGMSIEDVGDVLGYQDPRSFRRAFHRWFGTSPSAYRHQQSSD